MSEMKINRYDLHDDGLKPSVLGSLVEYRDLAAREDARDEEVRRLRTLLAAAVTMCPLCHGTGVWHTSCSMCGDSTYDHNCDDSEEVCDIPACVLARTALEQRP